ncbi:dihydrofolate reductase [Weissella viridescens]|uniref:dihydrofolate reductase family protein n=1 Tax=Weissella viridescens TaxID=1629 RepID=UPI001745FFBF|nr:dihydrofolate reductase family protein [Weissella viridescens]QOD85969.1 dihydrofolate reductase [Weissella viridescens]
MPRKVIFYGAISLDGYLADTHDNLDWLLNTDTGDATSYPEFISTVDTTISGKHTYLTTLDLLDGTAYYPDQTNYVFSHTLTTDDENIHIIADEQPTTLVEKLKQQAGENIWIIGGGAILSALISEHLLDEIRIQVAPILLGTGKRLFETFPVTQLELTSTQRFGELVELNYTIKF